MTSIIKLPDHGLLAMTRQVPLCVSHSSLDPERFPSQNRTPLTPSQIFQDISADHALKTVTIEAFPHSSSLQAASVHPCKHASVMKKVIERMNNSVIAEQLAQQQGGGKVDAKDKSSKKWSFSGKKKEVRPVEAEEEEIEGMRVDFYLVVFLKFIASIIPTIEVDSTTAF